MQQPVTPDSAGIIIGAAGAAANVKRHKTIMNCFRDRTSSYTRSNSRNNIFRYEQNGVVLPEAVVLLKEPRSRPNKLALLKSTSTRDLRYNIESTTTTSSTPSSSSSCSSSAGMSSAALSQRKDNCQYNECKDVEKRVTLLEQNLDNERALTKDLEAKISDLAKRVEELCEMQVEKRKNPKPSVRKKAINANNASVQPSKLVAWMKLSNLWKHRPSIETLKQQNIYNDEPCFDTEIELVFKHELHRNIPKIVVDCCDLIEEKYRKSSQPIEGIYRQCGDYNKIQTIRFRIDANDYDSLRQPHIDIHTLTGVLKLFLREIKSPLISINEAKTFIGKPNQWLLTEWPEKIDKLKRLIRSLPEINRDTMEYLFGHFNKLTKVPLQQVSPETLSLSVTPSIFHTVQQDVHIQDIHVLLKESEILADCVKIMIEYQNRIFECTERRQRRISVRNLKKTLSHPDLIFHHLF